MVPKEDLFQLVHSLSRSEKGYVRKYAALFGKQRTPGYMKLFDAIARQQHYNEEAIKQELIDEPLIERLPAVKNYLYHLILKSMRAYHSDRTALRTVQNLLASCTFLHEKNLHSQAYGLLTKARKIALESQDVLAQYLVVLKERFFNDGSVVIRQVSKKPAGASFAAERDLLEQLHRSSVFAEYSHICAGHFARQGPLRNERAPEQIRSIIAHLHDALAQTDLALEVKVLVYQTLILYTINAREYERSYAYLRTLLALLEGAPGYVRSNPYKYLYCLMNLGTLSRMLKHYDETRHYIRLLEESRAPSVRAEIEQQVAILLNRYFLCLDLASFGELLDLQKQIDAFLLQYQHSISDFLQRQFLFIFATTQFYLANYTGALEYIQRIFAFTSIDSSETIYCFAKILHILLHFELGNTALLPYEIRSTYRYLKKRKRLYRFESLVMRFLRTLPKLKTAARFQRQLRELHPKLLELREDPFENSAFSYCDIIVWVESRLEGKPMADILGARE